MFFKLTISNRLVMVLFVFTALLSCKSNKIVDETPVKKIETYYHGIELTIRDLPARVYRWNTLDFDSIMSRKRSNLLIREIIDKDNRVKQIDFLRRGKPTDFYDFPISRVTYNYEDKKIIETLYDKTGRKLFVDKHVSHYQSIYHLDSNNYIKNVERISDLITRDSIYTELANGPTPQHELEQDVKTFYERYYKNKPLEVEFYKYSYYKMNGVYPVSRDFVIDSSNYDYRLKNIKIVDGKRVSDTIYVPTLIQKGIEDGIKNLKSKN